MAKVDSAAKAPARRAAAKKSPVKRAAAKKAPTRIAATKAPAKRAEAKEPSDPKRVIKKLLEAKKGPEIVIGLVGPVGVDLDPVIAAIKDQLRGHYTTDVVKLSSCIEEFFGVDYQNYAEHERIHRLMTLGTLMRSETGRGDAVALLGIQQISRIRDDKYEGDDDTKFRGHAFVLRSLKTPQEIETLRSIYGRGFYLISVYSPPEFRLEAMARRIRRSVRGKDIDAEAEAKKLVARDEKESAKVGLTPPLGQDVRGAFPLADLFVDSRNSERMRGQVQRFMQLVFGHRFLTPSIDEHGMLHARAAALRSADMNRQVGAAIANAEGDLLALGCNDVPKAHGGLYWPEDENDDRDFKRKMDSMAEHRVQVLGELLNGLKSADLLKVAEDQDLAAIVDNLVNGEKRDLLKGTAAMNILEFGRSVHAEMAALTTAARLGIPVKGATLFCTTFPCHICARHIVASGIKRVVYVEPYPKSRAKALHGDAIKVDPGFRSESHVNFEPFQGVAPGKYFDVFEAADARKLRNGSAVEWSMETADPRFLRFLYTYTKLEDDIVGNVIPAMIALALRPPQTWDH